MREFDTRWVSMPILAILAPTIGNSYPWTVALAQQGFVYSSNIEIYRHAKERSAA
jgi:hypothetical protein